MENVVQAVQDWREMSGKTRWRKREVNKTKH